ncbi:MAG: helix-hairpin-helix domain-containing protein [Ferruginibacter sp.]
MEWKKFIAVVLSFTKKERRGTHTLLVIIILICIAPFVFPLFIKQKNYDHTAFEKEIAALKLKQADSSNKRRTYSDDDSRQPYNQPAESRYTFTKQTGIVFYFDPNTLDREGWEKLGIREKTINTIQNYLSKGGKFKMPGDINKIWGLSDKDKERLLPYVRIENAEAATQPQKIFEKTVYEKPKYTASVIDINTADTTAFISLPGIGSKLSQRIISFRDKLGGFYKIEQVAETFGLPDSTFQKIRPMLVLSDPSVKQFNINTATLDELKIHPYMRYNIANAIVQYRTQHGNFSSVNDLSKITPITGELLSKLIPYLKLE